MSRLRVAIAGATGYAGEELIRILREHPFVTLTALAGSAKRDQPVAVAELFPRFAGLVDLPVVSLDPVRLAESADLIFLALPHGVSMDVAPILLARGRKVIDLGGDFRLKDAASFERWYGRVHTQPELLARAVYALPELSQQGIAKATFIANPGCYATAIALACAPALKAGLADPARIIVDAKSGLTGAGRKAEPNLTFSEIDENMWPYKVAKHQHTPEVLQALAPFCAGRAPAMTFVPHVVPMKRGLLASVFLRLVKSVSEAELEAAYRSFYRDAPFIRVRGIQRWPQAQDVRDTNFCDIGLAIDSEQGVAIVISAIDNLGKGAAGQAVQNMNLMCGFGETTGLLTC